MENGYQWIEHTADLGLEIFSDSLSGIYEIAGCALFDLMVPARTDSLKEKTVETEGEDPALLLVNLLNDLIYHFEVEGLLFRELKTRSLENGRIVLDARCELLDEEGKGVETVVKAATRHHVEVEYKGSGWRGLVYLDL